MGAVSAGDGAGRSTGAGPGADSDIPGSGTTGSSVTDWEALADPAYPTSSPTDLGEPLQTLEPLQPVFDGVAVPAFWSRLAGPLQRALDELWDGSGLLERGRPRQWVTLHFGRMALHARGWERLRSSGDAYRPDPALADLPAQGLDALRERWERLRVWRARRAWGEELVEAGQRAERALQRAETLDLEGCDTPALARGPLDEREWTDILVPWLSLRVGRGAEGEPQRRIERGLRSERRLAAEIGRRLAREGVLQKAADVAYLTVDERIRSVHEASVFWQKLAQARARRVERFLDLEVPTHFAGRPDVELAKP
jgi:hypothetical protein